jgi:hypothetical protein
MIILTPGANDCVFTFDEMIVSPYDSLLNPYYLWKINNALTGEEVLFTIPGAGDYSPNPERYNQFTINIATSSAGTYDPYLGYLAFTASGYGGYGYDGLSQWSYDAFICEGPIPMSGTISLPATYSHVESGRIIMTL